MRSTATHPALSVSQVSSGHQPRRHIFLHLASLAVDLLRVVHQVPQQPLVIPVSDLVRVQDESVKRRQETRAVTAPVDQLESEQESGVVST